MTTSVDSSSSLPPIPPPAADASALARGVSGSAVSQLQQRLTDTGFPPGGVDGKFGPQTAKAVRSFQAAHQLPQTGSVDEATAAALQAAPTTLQRSLNTDSFQAAPASSVAPASAASTTTSPRLGETINSKALSVTSKLAVRPDLQPKGGVTHCNQFARAYATDMLGNTPQVQSLFSGNANQQYHQLAAAASSGNGVQEVSAADAGKLASEGKCVVVTTSTLSSGGHGHIAAVIGTGPNSSVRTGQAGTTNYADGPLSPRFTGSVASKAHYYVVD